LTVSPTTLTLAMPMAMPRMSSFFLFVCGDISENNSLWGVLVSFRFTLLTQAARMALEDADHCPALERFREYLHLLGRLGVTIM
jgi:hypothetical protein